MSFSFKHFTVNDELCAMKVGTDGVLLGAWAQGGKRVLDVGTGSGLIAMMMAQRFPDAEIRAIDIDEDACVQAKLNVEKNAFAGRISVENVSLQQFAKKENDAFDAIVCNPPFFDNALKNPDNKRRLARHTDSLPFRELFDYSAKLLSDAGILSVVIPCENLERFLAESYISGLFVVRQVLVKTVARKAPRRCLIAFSKKRNVEVEQSCELLQNEDGSRSEWYKKLTYNFYLDI